MVIDGLHYPFGIESGAGDDWQKPATWDAGVSSLNDWGYDRPRVLSPALLPRMIRQPVTTARVRFVETLSDLHTLERSIDSQVHLGPEALAWQTVFNGEQPITFPPQTTRRIIIDLDNYYCAYPEIVVSGGQGSSIRLYWAEALFEDQKAHANQIYTAFPTKGNRDVIESKYFYGTGDTFLLDGSDHRSYTTL